MQASAEPRSAFPLAVWLWVVVTLAVVIAGPLVLR
jgi:hypothetical protein